MGEVATVSANLPDAVVRLVPGALQEVHQRALQRPGVIVGRQSVRACLVQRVNHLAVDVELKLFVRGVADPHRP